MKKSIRIIGKRGSRARIAITKTTGIPLYKKKDGVLAIINYGLAGKALDRFFRKCPSAKSMPILNRYIGKSKYEVVNDADRKDILVPESRLSLTSKPKLGDWIEKKHHSIGGIGIIKARGRNRREAKYYQRFIKDRRYELRIHAFKWIDPSEWRVQKRLGKSSEIAWNYKNGGTFQTVRNTKYNIFKEAIKMSEAILDLRKMAFGAVDFIVDKDGKVYFIEINSAPGFTELSQPIYVDAFKALTKVSNKEILRMSR